MEEIADLFWLTVLGVIVFFYFSLRGRYDELRRAVLELQRELLALKRERTAEGVVPAAAAPVQPRETATIVTPPRPVEKQPQLTPAQTPLPLPPRPSAARAKPDSKHIEQQFGGRAFVWVGGVALALAGFYLVKYSIDTGLLTEQVRVILGLFFGLSLLAGSYIVRANARIANGVRIAQALAGAGIADLYGSLFAATTLYQLVPPFIGFSAMAVTTVAALILSLRHGAPIAALGLIGGYATPALVSGEPNAPLLFGYLYLVFAGLTGVIRTRNWWWLSVPATLVAFAWVVMWLAGSSAPQDAAWLSSFLFAIGATAALAERRTPVEESLASPSLWRRSFAPLGAVLLMGIVAYTANFEAFEWAMFALFSAGAIVLAWFDDRTYVLVPWQAMAVNLVMLLFWGDADPANLAFTILGFAVLFAASAQVLLSRARLPLSWGAMSAVALLAYFGVAWLRLDGWMQARLGEQADYAWTAIAFAGAGAMAWAASRRFVLGRDTWLRHALQAAFAVAATSLVSVGFAILLHQEYLSFALAAEVLAVAWIATRVDIPALRVLGQVLTALYAVSVYATVAYLLADVANVSGGETMPLLANTLFRFALPAALFVGASLYFRRRSDDIFVLVLELGAIALATIALYRLHTFIFFGHPTQTTLVIGSVFTNLLLLASIGLARIHRILPRQALHWGALAVGGFAVLRLVVFGFLVFNPLLAHQDVGAMPLLNGIVIIYVLPALLLLFAASEIGLPEPLKQGVPVAAYLLGFVAASLMVRQLFNGAFLDSGTIADAEVYSYSALWLAIGVALLFVAALRRDQMMRFSSLAVMLLTVGKVFLYDASALTGLWRVVSFLGLGLSLLALSWFYSRFIFVAEEPDAPA